MASENTTTTRLTAESGDAYTFNRYALINYPQFYNGTSYLLRIPMVKMPSSALSLSARLIFMQYTDQSETPTLLGQIFFTNENVPQSYTPSTMAAVLAATQNSTAQSTNLRFKITINSYGGSLTASTNPVLVKWDNTLYGIPFTNLPNFVEAGTFTT
jgi:hypothetical protein